MYQLTVIIIIVYKYPDFLYEVLLFSNFFYQTDIMIFVIIHHILVDVY